MIREALVLASFMLLPAFTHAPVFAQADEPRIEGQWSFQAWTGDDGCNFTGNATLTPPIENDGIYGCELTAKQTCTDGEWIVRQTCTAKRHGNSVVIKSAIVEFISEPSVSYLPDDFLLTVDTSKRMFGALHSYGVYKTVWIRENGDIS